jgi:hypothetical protein
MTLAHQALRDVRREMPYLDEDHLYVTVHPEVAKVLDGPERHSLVDLEKSYQKGIRVKGDPSFHIEQIAITPSNAPKLKGATALSPLPLLSKSAKTADFVQDEDDLRDDSAEYQADVNAIRSQREQEAKLETPIIREAASPDVTKEAEDEEDTDLEGETSADSEAAGPAPSSGANT